MELILIANSNKICLLKVHLHVSNFLLSTRAEYTELSRQALKFLIPFNTTYRCESGFSATTAIKDKYRNLLNIEADLRLKLSKIEPNISELTNNKQAQPSH